MTYTQAPYPEENGYRSALGFVKNNPLNNDHYVDLLKGDPWYPAVKKAHDELTRKYPGYNIVQIKEKFNELRFYVSQGNCPGELWDWVDARRIIQEAEQSVSGL